MEERLKCGPSNDRDPDACDDDARLDTQTTPSVAIIAGDISIVRELLENCSADADLDNRYFGRPLHLAASYGRIKIIEILLD
ncbi:uncharacterized protein EAF01_011082 [Botrytis porri]|uniref:uncharacterized protein n=1 Tax=Botrytis porri TaxID=87229 RepID=UPI0018FF2E45|nr:uncharacterized protein EAF01_011082 [Botrytis porri]KAF7887928.1 hypothetical protein EAF01_011082 [Botrytis porri]